MISEIPFTSYGNLKQEECYNAWNDPTVSEIVYGGAKGGAKSYTGASLILMDALTFPETTYFIARETLTDLRKYTIPTIFEVIGNMGIDRNYLKFNGQDSYFTCYNGSKIFLIEYGYRPSDPLYQRFGSMQMTRGWMEESGQATEAARNNLFATVGRWKNDVYKSFGLNGKMLETCNPSKNYLYSNFYRKFKEGTLEPYKRFIQAFPQDNKKLPSGYIENLERTLSKNEKERLLRGNWEYDDDPSALIDYDKILDIFTNNVEAGRKCITADIARLGGDRIVIIEWEGFRGKVSWYQKQVLNETARIIEEKREKMGIGVSDVLVDEDGLGGGLVDFKGYRGFVNNSSPLPSPLAPWVDGKQIKENYDNLKSQCYFRLSERINNNKLFLYCDENSKRWIIEELEQVKQKALDNDLKKGVIPKDKVKEVLGRSPDFADALMMREYFELKPQKGFVAATY